MASESLIQLFIHLVIFANILFITAIIATNLRAAFQLTQLAIPYLIASKGNIINVSSVCGMLAFENFLPYCISKAGLDQFTKCVAMEVSVSQCIEVIKR